MKIPAILGVVLVAALATSGCGDGSAGGQAASGERTRLTVGLVPVADVAPIHLGVEKGFFEKEGLEIEIQTAQGGAEVVPQVMSGDVQIGYSNTPSVFSAAARGLPLEIVAPAVGPPPRKQGDGENVDGAVMARKDSGIRTYADLAGKTVAVNALGNVAEFTVKAALDRHDIDRGKLELLEVPFPEMLAALDAGRADAAVLATPFKTMAERSGHYRAVGFPIHDVRPELIYTSYFVSTRWAEENQEVLARFLSALRKSMRYAAEHERETREAVGKLAKLPNELADAIPVLNRRPDCEELKVSSKVLAQLMVYYGALDREPNLDELVRPGLCEE
jgi:NitT/TauT family transport system substrate-binding protein